MDPAEVKQRLTKLARKQQQENWNNTKKNQCDRIYALY